MKKLFTLLFALVIMSSFPVNYASAVSYTQGGAKNPTSLKHMSIVSPLHIGFQNEQVTGVYNEPRSGEFHRGVDYSTYNPNTGNYNREVYPIANGEVYGFNNGSGNRYIILKHNYNGTTWYSIYMHLSSVSVTSGTVTTNTQIGVSGSTGGVAPHLHWEVNTVSEDTLKSTRVTVDPYPYLQNQYNVSQWTTDHSAVNFVNYFKSSGTLQATIYGIYNQSRSGPSSTPKAYWRYNGESTWRVANGVHQGSYVYDFSIPANTSKSYVEYIIYVKGKWFNNINEYDTHWNAVYNDASENPGTWPSSTDIVAERYNF
ncbi:M23 family metallopeptidase [Paenibacillus sp. 32O-W]|uniref:M23 family metallopeptidase n=1 Tax=Paenibacillus sp. 32O-W TaxID=1695218 RepID=UPI0011A5365C|nr:M23 family metallopeptidase [Paenibacillus sp. 32O-W]